MEDFISFFNQVFGINVTDSSVWQTAARALVVYLLGIAMLRVGKKRFLGKMSAFDTILAVIIGSLLGRAIVEPDIFVEISIVSLGLVLLHRLFSYIAAHFSGFGRSIKGRERVIVRDGKIIWKALHKSNLSKRDLLQALRLHANTGDIGSIDIARLERNGKISVLLKKDGEHDQGKTSS